MQYRAEIDGFRAIAVLAVILFHANFLGFPGGFIGVDIFFVISGYLITGILIETNFNYSHFYMRRARRILPAYFFVLCITSLFAAWILLPAELIQFAKSLLSANVFLSNFYFWQETNYFDQAAAFKPLIHTWSLGIEIQFYLLFPWLLKPLMRMSSHARNIWILLIFILCLSLAEFLAITAPITNYYFLTTRIWEFLLGNLLLLNETHLKKLSLSQKNILSFLGMIAVAAFILSSSQPLHHPGIITLWPLLGCAAVIAWAHPGTWVHKLLTQKFVVGIGLISFSLYLWHQPFLALFRAQSIHAASLLSIGTMLMLALASSVLSWRFVEKPWRSGKIISDKIFNQTMIAMFIFILALGACFIYYGGFPNRYPQNVQEILNEIHQGEESLRETCPDYAAAKACKLGSSTVAPSWALVGDSHAAAIAAVLNSHLSKNHLAALQLTQSTCAYAPKLELSIWDPKRDCAQLNKETRQRLLDPQIKNIILIGRYVELYQGSYANNGEGGIEKPGAIAPRYGGTDRTAVLTAYQDAITDLLQLGKTVYLVYPIPEPGWHVPDTVVKLRAHGNMNDLTISRDYFHSRAAKVITTFDALGEHSNLIRIYPEQLFCTKARCVLADSQHIYYVDESHLSADGAEKIISKIPSLN